MTTSTSEIEKKSGILDRFTTLGDEVREDLTKAVKKEVRAIKNEAQESLEDAGDGLVYLFLSVAFLLMAIIGFSTSLIACTFAATLLLGFDTITAACLAPALLALFFLLCGLIAAKKSRSHLTRGSKLPNMSLQAFTRGTERIRRTFTTFWESTNARGTASKPERTSHTIYDSNVR